MAIQPNITEAQLHAATVAFVEAGEDITWDAYLADPELAASVTDLRKLLTAAILAYLKAAP